MANDSRSQSELNCCGARLYSKNVPDRTRSPIRKNAHVALGLHVPCLCSPPSVNYNMGWVWSFVFKDFAMVVAT